MKFCLIGEKLGHSYSSVIHSFMGLNYTLCEVEKDRLNEFFSNCNYDGFNVTIPYKKDVISKLKNVSSIAKKIGAVNTVIKKEDGFYGYNTDYFGLLYLITRKGISLKDKNVLILGSGGASNTAVALCKDQGVKTVNVVSRSGELNYNNVYEKQDTQIIINATPVGMYPNNGVSPINLYKFKNLIAVFDCVYNPSQTELLYMAKQMGIVYSNGLSMLVAQAIKSEEIWLNKKIDDSIIENVIGYINSTSLNIILSGMPSCGKSTIGKLLAKKTNKDFIDIDEEILKIYGKTPSFIILNEGEKAFRDIESKVIKDVSKLSGKIISLGGGSILRDENVKNLKSNGIIFYIKRDLDKLICKDRPLSQQKGIHNLYNERKERYESSANFVIDNNFDIEKTVCEVLKEYESACNKWC